MSAPLVLTSVDLRSLASALDTLTDMHRKHGVSPGEYESGISLETEGGDTVTFRVSLKSVDESPLRWVIDDRSGS